MTRNRRARELLIVTISPLVAILTIYAYQFLHDRIAPREGNEFTLKAADGTEIHGWRTGAAASMDGVVIVLPDPAFDSNFNSKTIATNVGQAFAVEILREHTSYEVLSFDQRGTGRTNGESRLTPVSILASDLKAVRALAHGKVTVIAHGDSCATAAFAATSGLKADRFIFVSCGYSGTLLANWGARLFANMANAGVDEPTIDQCRKEWTSWNKNLPSILKRKAREPVKSSVTGESPDLLIFREALRELGWEKKAWTQDAMRFDVAIALSKIASDSNFFQPEFDLVSAAPEREAMLRYATIKERSKVLPGTDFFLFQTDRHHRTLIDRVLFTKNPFTQTNGEAIRTIVASIK